MKTSGKFSAVIFFCTILLSSCGIVATTPTISIPVDAALPTSTLKPEPTTTPQSTNTNLPVQSPASQKLSQLQPLSLPEFDARYSTGDIALSPDGKFMAVVSKDKLYGNNSIWVWNVNDLSQSLAGYEVDVENLWSVAFSIDEKNLAVGSTGSIIILDWKTGAKLETIELPNVWVVHLEYGPNDTLVSTGFSDKVIVWDLSRDEVKYSVDGITGFEPNSFAVSPDGKVLITGAYDGIHLWDYETGQDLSFREGPDGGIGIAPVSVFSSMGSFLASTGCSEFIFEGCSSGNIIIWKSDSAVPSVTTVIHSSWIKSLAFSSDEGTVASTGREGKIKLLNFNSGEIVDAPPTDVPGKLPPDTPYLVNDISFLSDGKLLIASTSEGIQLLNVVDMSWMPDLRFILSFGYPYLITAEGDNLNLRTEPSLNGEIIRKLRTGESVSIIDGPKIADDYVWWKVKIADGTEGWIVEMPGWYEFIP
jgi:WD40 repeat protein